MPDPIVLDAGGVQVLLNEAQFTGLVNARVDIRVAEAMAPILSGLPAQITALMQQAYLSEMPPEWLSGQLGGGGLSVAGFASTRGTQFDVSLLDWQTLLSIPVTPKSATSKILAIAMYNTGQTDASYITHVGLFRGPTNIVPDASREAQDYIRDVASDITSSPKHHGFMEEDIPGVTTEVVYALKAKTNSTNAAQITRFGNRGANDSVVRPVGASMLLLEKAA